MKTKFSCAGCMAHSLYTLAVERAWTWEEADCPSLIRQGKCYGSFISVLAGQGTGPSCFLQCYLKGCRQPTKVSIYVLLT